MNDPKSQLPPDQRERLAALYRKQPDLGPPADIDRVVLARAAESARRHKQRTPVRWIGAVATACVAVLAIGVVVRQMPPQSGPPALHKADRDETVRTEEPAGSPSPPAPRRRAPQASDRFEVSEHREAGATDQVAEPTAARASAEQSRIAPRMPRAAEEQADALPEPDDWLQTIETLIERGETERARRELERLLTAHPGAEIPSAIREALAEAD